MVSMSDAWVDEVGWVEHEAFEYHMVAGPQSWRSWMHRWYDRPRAEVRASNVSRKSMTSTTIEGWGGSCKRESGLKGQFSNIVG